MAGNDTAVKECGVCTMLRSQMDMAVRAHDRSAETDARVRLRQHMREAHGQELPWPW